jgi:hypothetical protein
VPVAVATPVPVTVNEETLEYEPVPVSVHVFDTVKLDAKFPVATIFAVLVIVPVAVVRTVRVWLDEPVAVAVEDPDHVPLPAEVVVMVLVP